MATGDEILAWKKAIQELSPEERTDCPICGEDLRKTKDGVLHCPFCGWLAK